MRGTHAKIRREEEKVNELAGESWETDGTNRPWKLAGAISTFRTSSTQQALTIVSLYYKIKTTARFRSDD